MLGLIKALYKTHFEANNTLTIVGGKINILDT